MPIAVGLFAGILSAPSYSIIFQTSIEGFVLFHLCLVSLRILTVRKFGDSQKILLRVKFGLAEEWPFGKGNEKLNLEGLCRLQ
jgi:hypothetical protein